MADVRDTFCGPFTFLIVVQQFEKALKSRNMVINLAAFDVSALRILDADIIGANARRRPGAEQTRLFSRREQGEFEG